MAGGAGSDMIKRGTLWVPVDVTFLDPLNKFGLGDAAVLAYIRLLAWCKAKGTDGKIPFSAAPSILNGTASDLEAAGLIAVDDDNHVIIRDWHKWHESADELEQRRAADRERQRRWRERRDHALSTREEKSSDRRVSHASVTRHDDAPWDVACRHGAPHNGRNCIECRTGKDIS